MSIPPNSSKIYAFISCKATAYSATGKVLTQCIEWRGRPQKIRSDNGREFIAHKTKDFLANNHIAHIPIQKGKPMQNGYVERFNRSYREGVLNAFILTTIEQAREETNEWRTITTIILTKALAIKHQLSIYEIIFSNSREADLLRQRVRISCKESNFSVIERIRSKILKHPGKIHFDDIEKLYVDVLGKILIFGVI